MDITPGTTCSANWPGGSGIPCGPTIWSVVYGGEEFLVILNKCDPASAETRAENLRAAISKKPFHTRSQTLSITISMGVALSTDFQNQSLDELLAEVDAALYRAKSAGRNCVRHARPATQPSYNEIHQGETTQVSKD